MSSEIRKRRKNNVQNYEHDGHEENDEKINKKAEEEVRKHGDNNDEYFSLMGSYWLTRIVFLRSISFIYFVAFLIGLHQNKELLGKNGLLPSDKYLNLIKRHFGPSNKATAFINVPTLLIFVNEKDIDFWLDVIAYAGLFLAAVVFILGAANMLMMIALWILYHSLVNIGQRWYSFGWESQLLETGFLSIFFCPLLKIQKLPVHTVPSKVVIYGYRWLIFRIMIGAGLIKIRGDDCWRDLTCMNYHYETQPVPNPLSYYLHQTPEIFHKFEVLTNHFVELIAPFFILLTRRLCIFGGIIQILFQVVLILSGNLSFLNWLTILPSIVCFDDEFLRPLFNRHTQKQVKHIKKISSPLSWGGCIRRVLNYVLCCMLLVLSIPVVQNLFSSRQAMNTSFDAFRIVNTYGAFGSVTKERTEVIFQATRNKTIIPDELGGLWQEYEFKCKPGLISRRPCLISPYHYRLDWLMWFSAFMNYQQNPWLIHLAAKLLQNDRNISSLLSHNPFLDGDPPRKKELHKTLTSKIRFIRGEHYRYKYTTLGSEEAETNWWKRTKIGTYFPIVDLNSLQGFLTQNGWQ